MDEARLGQQGTLTRVRAPTGSRPVAVIRAEYEWIAVPEPNVEPATGESAAMITPTVNTSLMNQFLEGLGGMLGGKEHAVLVCDQAGWHVARALNLPDNITLLHLPPLPAGVESD
jgi:hypothetical protein